MIFGRQFRCDGSCDLLIRKTYSAMDLPVPTLELVCHSESAVRLMC